MRPIHRRFLTHALGFWLIWLAAGPAAAQMRQIALPANDLVYDRVSRRLYASVPGRLGVLGNSVVAMEPETGRLGPYLFVGSEPGQLALSDDGQFLYVALDGAAAVARVDLREQRVDLQFPLGAGELGSFLVDDMAVLPGHPHSIAVARRIQGFSPRHEGVAVYDDGVPRARITPRHTGSNAIEFGATAERLYGLNVESSQFGFQRMRVDGAGVTVLDVGMVPGTAGDFTFHDGLIYSGTGRVIEPETRRLVGTFSGLPSPALVLPDSASRRVFFLTQSGYEGPRRLLAYDPRTFLRVEELQLPLVPGDAKSLVAWGTDGVAFHTDANEVVILRTGLRTPSVVAADLAVTGSGAPNPARAGTEVTFQLTVTNHGPDAASSAVLRARLPAAAVVSMTSTQGRCTQAGGEVTCDLGPLPAGGRATLTLILRSGGPGNLVNEATVSSREPDPNPRNNGATQRLQVVPADACPPGTVCALPLGATIRRVELITNDLVYDRVTGRIYASVPGRAGATGNSVTPIAPTTGVVGSPIPVGSEPVKLALSDDGQFLYVALDGAAAVRRIDMAKQAADLQFEVGGGPRTRLLYVQDMEALPGEPRSVAISRWYGYSGAGDAGVAIYDDGVPRPGTTGDSSYANLIDFSASAARLYGFNTHNTEFGFRMMEVNEFGVRVVDVKRNLFNGPAAGMEFDQGLIFTSTGVVLEPEEGRRLGTITGLGPGALVAPDHAAGRVYYLTGTEATRKLLVFDTRTFLQVGSLEVPGVLGRAGSLIRWGEEPAGAGGVAFRTDQGQVFVIQMTSPQR